MDPITLAVVAVAAYFVFFKGPAASSSSNSNVIDPARYGRSASSDQVVTREDAERRLAAEKKKVTDSEAVAIANDLSELPPALRGYVLSFLGNPLATPDELIAGADTLIAGCGGMTSIAINRPASEPSEEGVSRLDPTSALPGFPIDPTWCFQRAAKRLRDAAATRTANTASAPSGASSQRGGSGMRLLEQLKGGPLNPLASIQSALDYSLSLITNEELQTRLRRILNAAKSGVDLSLFPYDPVWLRQQADLASSQYNATYVAQCLHTLADAIDVALVAKAEAEAADASVVTMEEAFPALFSITTQGLVNTIQQALAGITIREMAYDFDTGAPLYSINVAAGYPQPGISTMQLLASAIAGALGESHPAVTEARRLLATIAAGRVYSA